MSMIGRNRNSYEGVNAPLPIQLNTSTYTNVLLPKSNRIGYKVSNDSAHDVIIKEMEASNPDHADRGFQLFKRSVYISEPDNVPDGYISIKALTGSPFVTVVES